MAKTQQGTENIGFIGAGNMANSLIRGMLAKGFLPQQLFASDLDSSKLDTLKLECSIQVGSSANLVAQCDVIVLAVKPQVMEKVCKQLSLSFGDQAPLVISIAAGITCNHLSSWLGPNTPIVRCMPNTPSLVGQGASGLFALSIVTEAQRRLCQTLMSSVGKSVWVERETDIDSVTALSGSGPAYFFLFMEAMQDSAIAMGLTPEVARVLTYQTALGAAELALSSTDSTAELRSKVTSPGGTTEKAIESFEAGGLRQLVDSALRAAQKRSVSLAAELGNDAT
ncbi:MAG: pyrroline-5-carboxylate reductase [Pseudohongiellaceae bacterium]